MELARKAIADARTDTDVSLGAERASTTFFVDAAIRSRRIAHDLVEQDRLLVDERLRRFRDDADIALAHERVASAAPPGVVALERMLADKATTDEREIHDTIVEQERQRSDDAVQAKRGEAASVPGAARRADTDESLGAERATKIGPSRPSATRSRRCPSRRSKSSAAATFWRWSRTSCGAPSPSFR